MPLRMGVMGGTFDPVHLGHLRMAEEAVELLGLDSLLFIPAASPPHKTDQRILPFEHRWRMLQLALDERPCFQLSDIERRLPGKSFTVVTLRALHQEIPFGTELYFLVGMDAFLELDTWWHFMELFQLAHITVLQRPGYGEQEVGDFLTRKISPLYAKSHRDGIFEHPGLCSVHFLENTPLAISSTQIRHLVASDRSIWYLVLPEIRHYIYKNNLYKALHPILEDS